MSRRRRDPILTQSAIDRWRRRLERFRATDTGEPNGPFLRRTWQRRRLGMRPLLGLLLAGWAVYVLLAGEHGLLAIRALEADREQLQGEIASIEAQLSAVRERLDEASRDEYLLEKTARETYGLCRPGEIVYRFDARDLGTDETREAEDPPLVRAGLDGP